VAVLQLGYGGVYQGDYPIGEVWTLDHVLILAFFFSWCPPLMAGQGKGPSSYQLYVQKDGEEVWASNLNQNSYSNRSPYPLCTNFC